MDKVYYEVVEDKSADGTPKISLVETPPDKMPDFPTPDHVHICEHLKVGRPEDWSPPNDTPRKAAIRCLDQREAGLPVFGNQPLDDRFFHQWQSDRSNEVAREANQAYLRSNVFKRELEYCKKEGFTHPARKIQRNPEFPETLLGADESELRPFMRMLPARPNDPEWWAIFGSFCNRNGYYPFADQVSAPYLEVPYALRTDCFFLKEADEWVAEHYPGFADLKSSIDDTVYKHGIELAVWVAREYQNDMQRMFDTHRVRIMGCVLSLKGKACDTFANQASQEASRFLARSRPERDDKWIRTAFYEQRPSVRALVVFYAYGGLEGEYLRVKDTRGRRNESVILRNREGQPICQAERPVTDPRWNYLRRREGGLGRALTSLTSDHLYQNCVRGRWSAIARIHSAVMGCQVYSHPGELERIYRLDTRHFQDFYDDVKGETLRVIRLKEKAKAGSTIKSLKQQLSDPKTRIPLSSPKSRRRST